MHALPLQMAVLTCSPPVGSRTRASDTCERVKRERNLPPPPHWYMIYTHTLSLSQVYIRIYIIQRRFSVQIVIPGDDAPPAASVCA